MEEKTLELLDREEVLMARDLSDERKLAIGAELFDLIRENVKAGIRLQNPGISNDSLRPLTRYR